MWPSKTSEVWAHTWEFLFLGPIPPVSDDIRSFTGTSNPPIVKSNEWCPLKAPYVKKHFFPSNKHKVHSEAELRDYRITKLMR